MLLAATVAGYFYVRPGDAKFWRRIAAAVRRAAVIEETQRAAVPSPLPTALTVPAAVATPVAAPEPTARPLEEPAVSDDAEPSRPPALPSESVAAPDPSLSPETLEPGKLAILFEHHLRRGNLQVWVDGAPVFDEDFGAQATRQILALTLRKGVVQEVLTLPPGRHEVTVEVRWDDNVKRSRISGTFAPGSTRRLDVAVGRLGGKLSLDWK